MLGCLAAHAAHRDAFDLSPLGKIWKLRLGESARPPALSGVAAQRDFGEGLYVVFADSSARAGAINAVNIDS